MEPGVTEELSTVTFEFVHTNPNGQEMVYQTIMLTNATVSSVRRYIGISTGSEPPDARPLEDVSLTFQKIEVQDSVGKTMFVDDWMAVR
jgi:type VI secretion system Hcp family effector